MPQMMPLNWIFLMLFFSLIFFIIFSNLFFYSPLSNKSSISLNFTSSNLNWLW